MSLPTESSRESAYPSRTRFTAIPARPGRRRREGGEEYSFLYAVGPGTSEPPPPPPTQCVVPGVVGHVPGDECSPRDFLLSNASGQTEDWHKFGMEWKEHIAWLSPMLATLAVFLVFYYGPTPARNRTARLLVLVVFAAAFTTAAIAGLFGALITKTAPIT